MAVKHRTALGALALSAAGLVAIVLSEGYTGSAVIPIPGDVPTIGFGSTEGVQLGDTITPPRAVARAYRDITQFEAGLKTCVTVALFQYEYDAYLSLSYNIGTRAFCSSTLVRKLNQGDYEGACAEISRWNKAGGREVPGLTARRERERATCEGRE